VGVAGAGQLGGSSATPATAVAKAGFSRVPLRLKQEIDYRAGPERMDATQLFDGAQAGQTRASPPHRPAGR